jgi:hypothetical protein
VKATLPDHRRRLIMLPELPVKSAMAIHQIDADNWIVKMKIPLCFC